MTDQVFYPNVTPLGPQSINTDGVTSIGEINSRAFREAIAEPDFRMARIAGEVRAYENTIRWCEEAIQLAGPYDDTRLVENLIRILGDKIRESHSSATSGDHP